MQAARIVLALALVFLAACSRETAETAGTGAYPGAPVIIISIDTLRADRLPAYGYGGVKTPHIDALRKDGVLFTAAYSHVPLTLPSHVSLFAGTLPARNGVRDNIGYRFSPSGPTLPGTLKKNGYATGAAVSAYVLRGETGLGSLFDSYDDTIEFVPGAELGAIQRSGSATVAAATRWIGQRGPAPFFYFLHLFEPHTPYAPPERFATSTSNPYDGEIAYVDAILGELLNQLKASGVYDRSLIVLLSDHGEGLGDHGEEEHGIFLYREALHVPLIVKLPGSDSAGATIETPAGLTDVFPTIMSLTGQAVPEGIDGVALLGPHAVRRPDRRIFAETLYPRLHLGWSDLRSLVDGAHHYIDAPRAELYSVRNDIAEKRNIVADERRVAAAFRKALETHPRTITAPSAASAEEVAKLKALGYVSAPAAESGGPLPDPKDGIAHYRLYLSANVALADGNSAAAIEKLAEVLRLSPQFTDAAIALARAYEASDSYELAAETYRGLLTRNPALGEQVALGAGTAFLNAGRLDEARAHAELALTSNPPGAHLLLGRIVLAGGDPAGARRHAAEAAKSANYRAQATLLTAQALLAENPPNAVAALRELDQLKRSRGGARLEGLEAGRANAFMYLSRPNEAIPAFRAEIAQFPRQRDAYGRLATVYLMVGDFASADAVLRELTRAIPTRATSEFAAEVLERFGPPGA
ncbi:MAG: sulfatase-like hydrolase/transferase, partial [Thermoanaerobaculia bacterium]